MAFHDDLLEQAYHLANRERTKPRQASLRRAVSAAYYAVFHLLIAEAVSKWRVQSHRSQLARIFEHSKMKAASDRVLAVSSSAISQDPTRVDHLRTIATTFRALNQQRQTADYDLASRWSKTDVIGLIDLVAEAFRSVKAIRGESIMDDYLLSLFLKERK